MKTTRWFAVIISIFLLICSLSACTQPLENPLDSVFPENLDDYISYPKVSDISLTTWDVEVTDEEVEAQIMLIRSRDSDLVAANRPCEKGDYIMIDYYGYIDGKLVEAFKEEECETVIGYGLLLPELEEAILGSVEGQVLRVTATLSDPFLTDIDYSGKEINFIVRLSEVDRQTLPDYTDEWVLSYCGYSSIASFEKALREKLLSNKQDEYENYLKETVWKEMMEGTTVLSYPEDVWNEEYNQAMEYYLLIQDYQNYSDEELWESLGCDSEESFISYVKDKINEQVKEKMLLVAVSRDFYVTLTEETLQEGKEKIVSSLGLSSVEALEEIYEAEDIFETVLLDHCQSVLVRHASLTPKS